MLAHKLNRRETLLLAAVACLRRSCCESGFNRCCGLERNATGMQLPQWKRFEVRGDLAMERKCLRCTSS